MIRAAAHAVAGNRKIRAAHARSVLSGTSVSVPVGAVMAFLLLRRRPSRLGLVGVAVVTAGILGYVPMIAPEHRMIGLLIGLGCASIMSTRAFAMELHPWNRQARTVVEKMRVTGLMLLVTSLMGLALLFSLMAMIEGGLMPPLAAIPTPRQLLHPPAIALGLFMGALVLTVMQYLGFSVVVKIRAENFLATTAMIPLVTIVFQLAAIALGILSPIPVDWGVLPASARGWVAASTCMCRTSTPTAFSVAWHR